jgi:hypothetical protein
VVERSIIGEAVEPSQGGIAHSWVGCAELLVVLLVVLLLLQLLLLRVPEVVLLLVLHVGLGLGF